MDNEYTEADVHKFIRDMIEKKGLRPTARHLEISASYLCDIRWRKRSVSTQIAKKLGFTKETIKVVVYKRKGQ